MLNFDTGIPDLKPQARQLIIIGLVSG